MWRQLRLASLLLLLIIAQPLSDGWLVIVPCRVHFGNYVRCVLIDLLYTPTLPFQLLNFSLDLPFPLQEFSSHLLLLFESLLGAFLDFTVAHQFFLLIKKLLLAQWLVDRLNFQVTLLYLSDFQTALLSSKLSVRVPLPDKRVSFRCFVNLVRDHLLVSDVALLSQH